MKRIMLLDHFVPPHAFVSHDLILNLLPPIEKKFYLQKK
jgi:hypothetical protein